jgi:hypothetical protein
MLNARIVPANGTLNFFDYDKVTKMCADKKKTALSKIGAYVRERARQSIKKAALTAENKKARRLAKKLGLEEPEKDFVPSKPGEPPRWRQAKIRKGIFGQPIKRILFGYEPDDGGNVAIGFGLVFGIKTGVPKRLEEGGTFTNSKGRTITVAKRPTLVPALAKEKAKAALMFADSL